MTPLQIHCGCGPIKMSGWINIDNSAYWNPDLCIDYLTLSAHFAENSAELAFACHTVEHLSFPEGVNQFFSEVFHVLKRNGVLRVVVPDLRLVASKYVRGENLRDVYIGPGKYYEGDIDCAASRFQFFCRAWDHTVLFDAELLGTMMRNAGFTAVHVCEFGKSTVQELRGLDRFPAESLSMEGTKP